MILLAAVCGYNLGHDSFVYHYNTKLRKGEPDMMSLRVCLFWATGLILSIFFHYKGI